MELHPILEKGEAPSKQGMWYVISADGAAPSMRVGHSAINIPDTQGATSGRVIFTGGGNPNGVFSEAHIINTEKYEWQELQCPGFKGRYEHVSFIPSSQPKNLFVFGGADQSSNLNDLQVFNLETGACSEVKYSGTPPSPRTCRGSVAIDDKLFVFGGGEQGAEPVADRQIHVYDAESASWNQPSVNGKPPKPRHGHSMVAIGNNIYIIGGMARTTFFNDVYEFDVKSCKWSERRCKGDMPPGLAAHSAVAHDNRIFIFGGMTQDGASDTLYWFNTESSRWSNCPLNGPPPASRLDHAMCLISIQIQNNETEDQSETASATGENAVPPGIVDITDNARYVVDGHSKKATNELDVEFTQPASPAVRNDGAGSDSKNFVAAGNEDITRHEVKKSDSAGDDAGDASKEAGGSESQERVLCLLIHGGMDTGGEIFDDCLVLRLDGIA